MVYYAPNTYKELKLAALREVRWQTYLLVETGRKHDGQEYSGGTNPFYSLSEFS
jgi:hypothetical protein